MLLMLNLMSFANVNVFLKSDTVLCVMTCFTFKSQATVPWKCFFTEIPIYSITVGLAAKTLLTIYHYKMSGLPLLITFLIFTTKTDNCLLENFHAILLFTISC